MNTALLHETSIRSLDGTMPFPEIVQVLTEIGLESYHVDLVQHLKTFYFPSGEVHTEQFIHDGPAISKDFSATQVVAAIRSSQNRQINYREFLNQIRSAGTTSYQVFLQGRKVIYFGRTGDHHVENFPSVHS